MRWLTSSCRLPCSARWYLSKGAKICVVSSVEELYAWLSEDEAGQAQPAAFALSRKQKAGGER